MAAMPQRRAVLPGCWRPPRSLVPPVPSPFPSPGSGGTWGALGQLRPCCSRLVLHRQQLLLRGWGCWVLPPPILQLLGHKKRSDQGRAERGEAFPSKPRTAVMISTTLQPALWP